MKYIGSKRKYVKEILPIILKERTSENQLYLEPFAGGMNVIQHVKGRRIANDKNIYLISLFKELLSDSFDIPDSITEQFYMRIKENKEIYRQSLVAFVGYCCSFGAKFFGGYARGEGRNYCAESKRHLLKQKELLQGVEFNCNDYTFYTNLTQKAIIYCDPPYKNTLKYSDEINHNEFWEWVRTMSKRGHKVFVSEYEAPKDFKCVWSKEVYNTIDKNTSGKKGIEKLFIYNMEVK